MKKFIQGGHSDVDLKNFPTKKFDVIYCDPPWPTGQWNTNKTTPGYTTLTMDALCSIPVSSIAKPNSVMFMWVIENHLEDAFNLIRSWGFKYICIAFIWGKVKVNQVEYEAANGMGFWTRKSGEICLFAKRGTPERISKNTGQLILAPRRNHSQKPEETYNRIEQMTRGSRIELFSRTKRDGWEAWGNEVGKFK